MTSIKFKYSTNIVKKERNLRFFKSSESILNLSVDKNKLMLYANGKQEFLDLHSIKTNKLLIPILFESINSKVYLIKVLMISKNDTPRIKNNLENLIDKLTKSFKISKHDEYSIYKLVIRFTNLKSFSQIETYLKVNDKVAS